MTESGSPLLQFDADDPRDIRYSPLFEQTLPSVVDLRGAGSALPPPYDATPANSTAAAIATIFGYQVHRQDPREAFLPSLDDLISATASPNPSLRDCLKALARDETAAAAVEIDGYARVDQDANALRACLAEGHPVACSLRLPETEIARAVVLIGYDASANTFRYRNAQGADWGDDGDGTIPAEYLLTPENAGDFWTIRGVRTAGRQASRNAADAARPLLQAADTELKTKWKSVFESPRALLNGEMRQPQASPEAGVLVSGDETTIYVVSITDSGTTRWYISAKSIFHGWTVAGTSLYVVDGPEASVWDLTAEWDMKSAATSPKPVKAFRLAEFGADENRKVTEWKTALQRAEWARLLEQAEEEWPVLTAEQNAAPAGSPDRDRLDALAADVYAMMRSLRKLLGADPARSASGREKIAAARQDLAAKRAAAKPVRFSAPAVVRQALEQSSYTVFIMQGNGVMHAAGKSLAGFDALPLAETAEPVVAVLPEKKLVAYISQRFLYTIKTSGEKQVSHYVASVPFASDHHTLTAANGQFWWANEHGVRAIQPDAAGVLKPTFLSGGAGWTTRQAGRLESIPTKLIAGYQSGSGDRIFEQINPNALFDAMNLPEWMKDWALRSGSTGPNDGILTQLMLADESGRYTTPPVGKSYLVYGPFARNAGEPASQWSGFRFHAGRNLAILDDTLGGSALYATSEANQPGVPVPLPRWSSAPWLSRPIESEDRTALQAAWPVPTLVPLESLRPRPDLADAVTRGGKVPAMVRLFTTSLASSIPPDRPDQLMRFFLWFALLDAEHGQAHCDNLAALKEALGQIYTPAQLTELRTRIGRPGQAWQIARFGAGGLWNAPMQYHLIGAGWPVNQPPWEWKTPPTRLFSGPIPKWFDPWGCNNPQDFFPVQPTRTFFDPVRLETLRFPQRPATFAKTPRIRSWSTFTNGDPAVPVTEQPAGAPSTLIASADEDRARTTLRLLPTQSRPQPILYDPAAGRASDPSQLGFFREAAMTPATVYALKLPSDSDATACCVVSPEFAGTRIRSLASDTSEKGWGKFFDANRAKLEANLTACALPEKGLPRVAFHAYRLPLPPQSVSLLALPPKPAVRASLLRDIQPEWRQSFGGLLQSPPVVLGDRVIGVDQASIFAHDLYTGDAVTAEGGFPLELTAGRGNVPPRPVSWGGSMYFANNRRLRAVQLSDGKRKPGWSDPEPELGQVVSVNAAFGVIAVTQTKSGKPQTVGFDAATGKVAWGPVTISQLRPGPVCNAEDSIFFVADGNLFGLNVRFGDKRFTFDPTQTEPAGKFAPLSPAESPAIGMVGANGVLVCAGAQVFGLDLVSGKVLWTFTAEGDKSGTQWFRPAVSEAANRVVLVNHAGDVSALELSTGKRIWWDHQRDAAQPSLVGDQVYIGERENRSRVHVYRLLSPAGQQAPATYPIGGALTHEISGGSGLAIFPVDGELRAVPAGSQKAALFDGESAMIEISADRQQFDFGVGEFTIEAWLRTTRGGEILSGCPTDGEPGKHGFRLNVTGQGEIRFAVTNSVDNIFASHTSPTRLADGAWRHLALVRRGNSVEVYVDGVSQKVHTLRNGEAPLSIGGASALTIGACVEKPGESGKAYFAGLIRDVRLWSTGLDAAKIIGRMGRSLSGLEPQLLGYWQLNEPNLTAPKNEVARHTLSAKSRGGLKSFITDLKLDTSAWPYLLDQPRTQWPYAGHWAARGAQEVGTPAAIADSGIVCFGISNAIYGVHASDGQRAWSVETPYGASAPIAAQGKIYALTGDRGVIAIHPVTGVVEDMRAFDGLLAQTTRAGASLAAMAGSGAFLAAASPAGDLWILDRTRTEDALWKTRVAAGPADLLIVDDILYAVADRTLYAFDAANRRVQTTPVASSVIAARSGRVFALARPTQPATRPSVLLSLDAADLNKVVDSWMIPAGVEITGLAASRDADLLVVSTGNGEVLGLSLVNLTTKWTSTVTRGAAVLRPAIVDRDVYCTSSAGALSVFDISSGELRGRYESANGIVTAPVVQSGAAYFGGAEAPPSAQVRDGALHSVVFGSTYALRIGIDGRGAAEPAARCGYAECISPETLPFLDPGLCSVEAWINTAHGGQILSLTSKPKEASEDDGAYSLALSVDGAGIIRFVCLDQSDPARPVWHQIVATANSANAAGYAADGKWHHVAVSRTARETVKIYYDGIPIETNAALTPLAAAPQVPAGSAAYIGAALPGAAANPFRGMIAEVRVWETYLAQSRIAERMHHKFAGQHGLLAYWDFDTREVHDQSARPHHGCLQKKGDADGIWLTDLNFTRPQYPQMQTKGSRLQVGVPGSTPELADTIYQLTIRAKKADGSPLASHPVSLWYVRHKGEGGPSSFPIAASGKAEESIAFVKPGHGAEGCYTATTGMDGILVFTLRSPAFTHGPSLDLRAGFMPENERCHVNVLLDEQKLEPAPPPRLEVKSRLIQDYHHSPGGDIDEKRDRSTYRTVIRTVDADGRARSGERIQLWAAGHTEIEVNGRKYPVTPQNGQTFFADAAGEVTIVSSATDLQEAPLSLWAGFMHRDERCNLQLGQDAHRKLANLTEKDLTEPRTVNWKRGEQDSDSLVDKEYQASAGKVAGAVSRVMSVTQPAEEPPQRRRKVLRAPLRSFSHLHYAPPARGDDSVRVVSTMRHISRATAIEPRNFAGSQLLRGGLMNGGSAGFVIGATEDGVVDLIPLNSAADLPEEMRQPAVRGAVLKFGPGQLGGIFDFVEDAWNTVKDAVVDAANAVAEAARRVAVFIDEQVNLVIEYANRVVSVVVETVEMAVAAVVKIFNIIKAAIEKVIMFLRMLFDWGAILDVKNTLKGVIEAQFRAVRSLKPEMLLPHVERMAGSMTSMLSLPDCAKVRSAGSSRSEYEDPDARDRFDSVEGKYAMSKSNESPDRIRMGSSQLALAGADISLPLDPMEILSSVLGQIANNPFALSLSELLDKMVDLMKIDVASIVRSSFVQAFDGLKEAIDAILGLARARIDIPFLSELYEFITGDTLSILDFVCLAAAIPLHIGYSLFMLAAHGTATTFMRDSSGLREMTAAMKEGDPWSLVPTKSPLLKAEDSKPDDAWKKRGVERAMVWTYSAYTIYATVCGGFIAKARIASYEADGWGESSDGTKLLMVMNSLFTIGSRFVLVFGIMIPKIEHAKGSKQLSKMDELLDNHIFQMIISAMAVLSEGGILYKAWNPQPDGPNDRRWGEKASIAISVIGAGLLVWRIIAIAKRDNLSTSEIIIATTDIMSALGFMIFFGGTRRFVRRYPRAALSLVGARYLMQGATAVMQVVAYELE